MHPGTHYSVPMALDIYDFDVRVAEDVPDLEQHCICQNRYLTADRTDAEEHCEPLQVYPCRHFTCIAGLSRWIATQTQSGTSCPECRMQISRVSTMVAETKRREAREAVQNFQEQIRNPRNAADRRLRHRMRFLISELEASGDAPVPSLGKDDLMLSGHFRPDEVSLITRTLCVIYNAPTARETLRLIRIEWNHADPVACSFREWHLVAYALVKIFAIS